MKCVIVLVGGAVLTNAHSSLANAGMSLAGVKVLKAKWKTGMANVDRKELSGKSKLGYNGRNKHIKHAVKALKPTRVKQC